MIFNTLKFEMKSDDIGLLSFDRPKSMNALNKEAIKELGIFLEQIKTTDIRCLIITGAGEKAFVAGADIKELMGLSKEEAKSLSRQGQNVFTALEALKFPVIASVNGFALGGGMELALACDFIISSEKAVYALPEVSLGLIPGYGGTQRLARSIGVHRAKMMTFTGDLYSAEKLYDWGLISKVCKAEDLEAYTLKIAKKIAQRAPLAVAKSKHCINLMRDLNMEEGLLLEQKEFSEVFLTEDSALGLKAFIEKRTPKYLGL